MVLPKNRTLFARAHYGTLHVSIFFFIALGIQPATVCMERLIHSPRKQRLQKGACIRRIHRTVSVIIVLQIA